MDLHTLKLGLGIAVGILAAIAVVFALYVKLGEIALRNNRNNGN